MSRTNEIPASVENSFSAAAQITRALADETKSMLEEMAVPVNHPDRAMIQATLLQALSTNLLVMTTYKAARN